MNLKILLDHALLYFGYESAWPRQSLTRVVELLYVFVFGYLAAARRGPLPRQRGAVLILAAVAEATLHSLREGQLRFGILTSLAMTWPLVPWLQLLPSTSLMTISVLGGIMALTPVSPSRFDYGPWLVLSQLALEFTAVIETADEVGTGRIASPPGGVTHALPTADAWVVLAAPGNVADSDASGGNPRQQWFPTAPPNLSTFLIGHPLAAMIIVVVERFERWESPAPLRLIASRSLTFYVGHCSIFSPTSLLDS